MCDLCEIELGADFVVVKYFRWEIIFSRVKFFRRNLRFVCPMCGYLDLVGV